MFSIDDIVLVYNDGKYEIGIVVRKYKKRGYRVYDVALERGTIFMQIRVDNKKSTIFIDSQKTKTFGQRVSTKLTSDVRKSVSINIEQLQEI